MQHQTVITNDLLEEIIKRLIADIVEKNETDMEIQKQQNQKQIHQKSTQDQCKIDQTSTQNQSQIDPNLVQRDSRGVHGVPLAVGTDFGTIFGPTWGILGAKLGTCCGHGCKKMDFKRILKAIKNDNDFQHHLGPSWD